MSDLPVPSPVKPPSEIDPWDLWHDVVAEVKQTIIQPTFWQALEVVIPITIEGSTFVIGLPEAGGRYHSYLSGNENRTKLERIAGDLSGLPLRLRLIEGTEEEDWENLKRREQAIQNSQEAFRNRLSGGASTTRQALTWESLQERIYSMYSQNEGNRMAQGRAQFLLKVIPIIDQGSEQLLGESTGQRDPNERALARLLEKVASLIEVPGAMVALELARYQESKKRQMGQ